MVDGCSSLIIDFDEDERDSRPPSRPASQLHGAGPGSGQQKQHGAANPQAEIDILRAQIARLEAAKLAGRGGTPPLTVPATSKPATGPKPSTLAAARPTAAAVKAPAQFPAGKNAFVSLASAPQPPQPFAQLSAATTPFGVPIQAPGPSTAAATTQAAPSKPGSQLLPQPVTLPAPPTGRIAPTIAHAASRSLPGTSLPEGHKRTQPLLGLHPPRPLSEPASGGKPLPPASQPAAEAAPQGTSLPRAAPVPRHAVLPVKASTTGAKAASTAKAKKVVKKTKAKKADQQSLADDADRFLANALSGNMAGNMQMPPDAQSMFMEQMQMQQQMMMAATFANGGFPGGMPQGGPVPWAAQMMEHLNVSQLPMAQAMNQGMMNMLPMPAFPGYGPMGFQPPVPPMQGPRTIHGPEVAAKRKPKPPSGDPPSKKTAADLVKKARARMVTAPVRKPDPPSTTQQREAYEAAFPSEDNPPPLPADEPPAAKSVPQAAAAGTGQTARSLMAGLAVISEEPVSEEPAVNAIISNAEDAAGRLPPEQPAEELPDACNESPERGLSRLPSDKVIEAASPESRARSIRSLSHSHSSGSPSNSGSPSPMSDHSGRSSPSSASPHSAQAVMTVEGPHLIAELKAVLEEKKALLLRKKVLDSIFADAKTQYDRVRKRELKLRALLGGQARLAEEDQLDLEEMLRTAASGPEEFITDAVSSLQRRRQQSLRKTAWQRSHASGRQKQGDEVSPLRGNKRPDSHPASLALLPNTSAPALAAEGAKRDASMEPAAAATIGKKRQQEEDALPTEAPQAHRAKVTAPEGPTPEDLRQALLRAKKGETPKPGSATAQGSPAPSAAEKAAQTAGKRKASTPIADKGALRDKAVLKDAEGTVRQARESSAPERGEQADVGSSKAREPEAARGKEEKDKDRERERERRERDGERDRERRRERKTEKERERRHQRERDLEERERDDRRRRDRMRETDRSDRRPTDRDRERDRERGKERGRSREASERLRSRGLERSRDKDVPRSSSKRSRTRSRSPSLSTSARAAEERHRRNSMRSPTRLSSLRSRSRSPHSSRPRSSTRTDRPKDSDPRPGAEPSRLGRAPPGRVADGTEADDVQGPSALGVLPPPPLAPLSAPAVQQQWPQQVPQGYTGFGSIPTLQQLTHTSASAPGSTSDLPPPPPLGEPGAPASGAAIAVAWAGQQQTLQSGSREGSIPGVSAPKMDAKLAKHLAASHLAASLSVSRGGSGGSGEWAQHGTPSGAPTEPSTPDAAYLAVKASALKHLEKTLGSGEFRQQSAELQHGPGSGDHAPASTAGPLASAQPAQQIPQPAPEQPAIFPTRESELPKWAPFLSAPWLVDNPKQSACTFGVPSGQAASAAPWESQVPQRPAFSFGVPSVQAASAPWPALAFQAAPLFAGQPAAPQELVTETSTQPTTSPASFNQGLQEARPAEPASGAASGDPAGRVSSEPSPSGTAGLPGMPSSQPPGAPKTATAAFAIGSSLRGPPGFVPEASASTPAPSSAAFSWGSTPVQPEAMALSPSAPTPAVLPANTGAVLSPSAPTPQAPMQPSVSKPGQDDQKSIRFREAFAKVSPDTVFAAQKAQQPSANDASREANSAAVGHAEGSEKTNAAEAAARRTGSAKPAKQGSTVPTVSAGMAKEAQPEGPRRPADASAAAASTSKPTVAAASAPGITGTQPEATAALRVVRGAPAKPAWVPPPKPGSKGITFMLASNAVPLSASSSAFPLSIFSMLGNELPKFEPGAARDATGPGVETSATVVLASSRVSAPYESPLLSFRSYRLCSTYKSVSCLPLSSRTYANRLEPHWVLCPFEARGSCRDLHCPYQMNMDHTLVNTEVLQDLRTLALRAGQDNPVLTIQLGIDSTRLEQHAEQQLAGAEPHILLIPPSSFLPSRQDPLQQLARKPRVPKAKWQELAVGGTVAEYSVVGQGVRHPYFRSIILASAQGPPASLVADLCPGWEGYPAASGAAVAAASARRAEEDQSTGRYFSKSAALPTDNSGPREPRWVAVYEEQLKVQPNDDELWLAYAMEYAGPGTEEGEERVTALKILARALEAAPNSSPLWLLYLHLYSKREDVLANPGGLRDIVEAALKYQPLCYRLWLLAASKARTWGDDAARLTLLQRGIISLAAAPCEEGSKEAEMRASCVLDLALRLMQQLSLSRKADLHAWLQALAQDASIVTPGPVETKFAEAAVMDDRKLAQMARSALLRALHPWPRASVTLWLAAAHLAAWGRVPDTCIHRLGYGQRPEALEFRTAPPASANQRVHALLSAASGSGVACLNLRAAAEAGSNAASTVSPDTAEAVCVLALSLASWQLITKSPPILGTSIVSGKTPSAVGEFGTLLMAAAQAADSLTRSDAAPLAQAAAAGVLSRLLQLVMWHKSKEILVDPVGLDTKRGVDQAKLPTSPQPAKGPRVGHTRSRHASTSSPGKAANGRVAEGSKDKVEGSGNEFAAIVAELWRIARKDKARLNARLAEVTKEEKDAFYRVVRREKQKRLAAEAAAAAKKPESQEVTAATRLAQARTVLDSVAEMLQEFPGVLVEVPKGLVGVPPAMVAVLACCAAQTGENENAGAEIALALLAAAVIPIPGDEDAATSSRAGSGSRSASRSLSPVKGARSRSPTRSHSKSGSKLPRRSRSRSGSRSRASRHRSRSRSRGRRQRRSSTQSPEAAAPPQPSWLGLVVGGDSKLAGNSTVSAAFQELLSPKEPSALRESPEEGEIPEEGASKPAPWGIQDTAWTWLNRALFAALSKEPHDALVCCQRALEAADGLYESWIWPEYLAFAGKILLGMPSPVEAPQSASTVQRRRDAFGIVLAMLRRFSSANAAESALQVLELPAAAFQDAALKKKLQPPAAVDGGALASIALSLAPLLQPSELASVVELVAARQPVSGGAAQVAIEAAAVNASSEQWASWAVPLAAGTLAAAVPTPAPHLWQQAVVLAERHFPSAALELADRALQHYPHSPALIDKRLSLAASTGAGTR